MKYILIGILLLSAGNVGAEPFPLTTPRGAVIDVIEEFPEGLGPFSTVVLAPGQGYHMQMPTLELLAKKLLSEGIAVYRFNWAYYTSTPRGDLSDGFALEIEDMQTVITKAKSDSRVDQKRLWAAGKSLGSSVAWHVLAEDSSLRGGVLLTPVCSQVLSGTQTPSPLHEYYYPNITEETRPMVFGLGDSDPLCSVPILYNLIADLKGQSRIIVVGGNHSFESLPLEGNEALEKNFAVLNDFVALAIRQWSVSD